MRRYEATIFTNKQRMDPGTTTKASSPDARGTIEVFKHNVSELVETENYTYRFLTTSFVSTAALAPYKVVASTHILEHRNECGRVDHERPKTLSRGVIMRPRASRSTSNSAPVPGCWLVRRR